MPSISSFRFLRVAFMIVAGVASLPLWSATAVPQRTEASTAVVPAHGSLDQAGGVEQRTVRAPYSVMIANGDVTGGLARETQFDLQPGTAGRSSARNESLSSRLRERIPTEVHLPEPTNWSAVLATMALAAFFFVRRVR